MSSIAIDRADPAQVGKASSSEVSKRDLTGLAQQIAYNILFALGHCRSSSPHCVVSQTQRVSSDAQNPVQPVTD